MSLRLFGKIILISLIILFCVGCFLIYKGKSQKPKTPTTNTEEVSFLPSTHQGSIVNHQFFTLSYSEHHEQAEWVAYELKPEHLEKNTARSDNFKEDPLVKTGSATLKDYKNSGYDRGHLLPSADRTFSEEANNETFYLSNMSPQEPSFNRGIWKKLEEQTREYVLQKGDLYIVTGPVLVGKFKEIGENKVDVPNYYYKILFHPSTTTALAFLLKNEKTSYPLDSFLVSIDSLESFSGIDFFVDFEDQLEVSFESKKQDLW